MFKDLILCVCVCVFSPYAECVPHGLESYLECTHVFIEL